MAAIEVEAVDVLASVAIVTLLVNMVLVEASRRASNAAVEQAEVARRTLEAQSQPMLLDVALDTALVDKPRFPQVDVGFVAVQRGAVLVSASGDDARCSLPLRNVGKGPARIGPVRVLVTDENGDELEAQPHYLEVERPNLPVAELTRINFEFQGGDPGYSEWYGTVGSLLPFHVDVAYSDFAGGARDVMRFTVAKDRNPHAHYRWFVDRVDFAPEGFKYGV